jgi:STE24 endopeptidase
VDSTNPRERAHKTGLNEDKATRYHRLKRQASVLTLVASVALLALLIATGASAAIRDVAERAAGWVAPQTGQRVLAVAIYVALLSLLNELVGLPIAFYSGFRLEHRYELSSEKLSSWLWDQTKAFAIGLVLAEGSVELVYALMHRSPEAWWLSAGLIFAFLTIGLTNLAPVLLLPLFYSIKPLERDGLRIRLLAIADRAGADVVGAYECAVAGKTRKANAALAGIGATRRILVSDTMLAEYSDEEIEVVLAHEMAHHVHGDIWKGILFQSGLTLGGLYLASELLRRSAGVIGLRGVDDVAGLPLLVLAAGAVSLIMLPAAHAMSRAYERSADRFALDLTRNPAAFISAMRRLAAQNLAEDPPSRLVQWLFYSHPPIQERIAAAETFKTAR